MQESFYPLLEKIKMVRKKEEIMFKCTNIKIVKETLDRNLFDVESGTQHIKKVDIKKACKYTGLKYGTCYDKFKSHKLNFTKIGKKPIFDMKDISDFILSHKVGDWTKISISDNEVVKCEKTDLSGCEKITGLCYETFYSHMVRENLPHLKYGNKRIFLKDLIEKWANKN